MWQAALCLVQNQVTEKAETQTEPQWAHKFPQESTKQSISSNEA